MKQDKIFEFIKKVNAISHIGITYSTDPYALDNYKELLELSTSMIHEYVDSKVKPYNIYHNIYYPTPQPCVRVMIFKDSKLLMVQDDSKAPNKWTLPGGWCDIDTSPVEAAIKESFEETGYKVKITKLLAVLDRNKYQNSEIYSVYQLIFFAEIVGGSNNPNYEIEQLDFFDLDVLPEFSNKLSREEFDIALKAYNSGNVHFE
jgi:8-oxo-dGTP diphosphatase